MDLYTVPADLRVPSDDGATDHLRGIVVASLGLRETSGRPA